MQKKRLDTLLRAIDSNRVGVEQLASRTLIRELYNRGVSIEAIFGAYYELEQMHNPMQVRDAELVSR